MNAAAAVRAPGSTADPAMVRMTLDNGLRVVLLRDRRLPLVASENTYEAGSRHEPEGLWGLAHLTEHVVYEGPGEQPGYPERIQLLGGLPQAVTSFDRTRYTALFPAPRLRQALRIEAERLAVASTGAGKGWAESVERQRRVLLAERRERLVGRPRERAFERLHRLLFSPGHPYRRSPAGLAASLRRASWQDVLRFSSMSYAAAGAVLVLAGDLPDAIEREVEAAFRGLGSGPRRVAPVAAAPTWGERRGVIQDRVLGPATWLAWRVGGFGTRAAAADQLLATCLAVGRSSPLQRALVQPGGLVRFLRVFLTPMRDTGTVVLWAAGERGVAAERLTEELTTTLDRLLRQEVSATTLQSARKRALLDHYLKLQDLASRADLAACFTAFLDRPESLAAEPGQLLEIDAATLESLANSWQRERHATLTILPAGARK